MDHNTCNLDSVTHLLASDEFIKTLELITQKDMIDIIASLAPIIISIIAIVFTYQSFKSKLKEVHYEYVIAKNIDRLHEASDLFFEYLDSQKLFFSMAEKVCIREIEGRSIEGEFHDKYKITQERSFQSFSGLFKAAFIYETLNQDDLSERLKELHEYIVEEKRQTLLGIENKKYDSVRSDIEKVKFEINIRGVCCTNAIKEAFKKYNKYGYI